MRRSNNSKQRTLDKAGTKAKVPVGKAKPQVGAQFAKTDEEDKLLKKVVTGKRLTRNMLKELGFLAGKVRGNPDKIDLKTYNNMYDTDETVQSGVEFISLSALSMLGPYSHEDTDITEAVTLAIKNLQESWLNFWDELITDGCINGFANAEICMSTKSEDGTVEGLKTTLDALVGIDPQSGKFSFDLDENSYTYGDIDGFVQWHGQGPKRERFIPAAKMVTWSHKSRHGNAYGTSRLKCIWKNWVIKDQMLKSWALAMDRSGSPVTWIQCSDPETMMEDPITGEQVRRVDWLLDLLDDMENVTGFVVGENEQVGQIQVPRSVGADFKIIVDHMNAMIYRGLLIPILLIDTADVGSNALAQQHFKAYIMSMSKLMQTIIPIIVRSVIKPFIIANFGKQKDYGTFLVKELAEESLKIISDIYYSATQAGYLTPKMKKDMDNYRKALNIPPQSQEEHDEMLKIVKEEEEAAKPQPQPGAIDPKTGKPVAGQKPKTKQPVGGRKGNPSGPQPEKPGTRPAPKAPTKKQGRPKS